MPKPSKTDVTFFEKNGFAVVDALIDPDLLKEAHGSFERILEQGELPKGVQLNERAGVGLSDPQNSMIRINYPHLADESLHRVITESAIGEWAASLLGAEAIQVFFAHMLHKPPDDDPAYKVGWHQDGQYTAFFNDHFVTAWIPLTSITPDSSPMNYVVGSHLYDEVIGGSSLSSPGSIDELKIRMLDHKKIEWKEEAVVGPLGTVSFHHSMTVHGTRPNYAEYPRRSLTVHMRSEKGTYRPENPDKFAQNVIKKCEFCPVIFGSPEAFPDIH
ncbi:MAG: phytanoyl-CoA dioxygenase family protein [Hyphomicrobiales bacterium]